MCRTSIHALAVSALLFLPAAPQAGEKTNPAFEPLFNGKDLTGWGYKSGEKFDGKTESDDKRFTAKDGMIVVHPGKGIKQLWTTRVFPYDFELRLEFRAAVNADSGLFLREPQLQVRDYLVAGPYKQLKKYKAAGLERDRRDCQGTARALHLQWGNPGSLAQAAGNRRHRTRSGPRPDGIPQRPTQGATVARGESYSSRGAR